MTDIFSSVNVATQIVLNEISRIQEENNSRPSQNKMNYVIRICKNLKSLMDWNFDFEKFYCNLSSIEFPLEMLWNFHVFHIMPFDIYLQSLRSSISIKSFKERLITFSFQSSGDNWSLLFAQTGILSYIVSKPFPTDVESAVEVEDTQVCKSIMDHVFNWIFSLKESEISSNRLKPFFALWTCGTLESESLQSFCSFYIRKFLTESNGTENEAFYIQENVVKKAEPFHLLVIFEKAIKVLKTDELEFILSQAIWNNDTNWKNFVVILASIIESSEKESFLIKKLGEKIIKEGFDQPKSEYFKRAIIIARQLCLKSNLPFVSAYGQWFQRNIREGIQTRSAQAITFLIKVLSELVPYETNIESIKFLLEKPLVVPQECQSIYWDYVSLLKTRIKDLQPRVNTEKVLKKVLNIFQETGKIPPYILEASLMHKHHYLNEFLPALLVPRVLPSSPDTREKFIDLLNKSGKIPTCIFQQYKLSCEQEQQNLLAGINMVDENLIEFMDEDIQIIN